MKPYKIIALSSVLLGSLFLGGCETYVKPTQGSVVKLELPEDYKETVGTPLIDSNNIYLNYKDSKGNMHTQFYKIPFDPFQNGYWTHIEWIKPEEKE